MYIGNALCKVEYDQEKKNLNYLSCLLENSANVKTITCVSIPHNYKGQCPQNPHPQTHICYRLSINERKLAESGGRDTYFQKKNQFMIRSYISKNCSSIIAIMRLDFFIIINFMNIFICMIIFLIRRMSVIGR